MRATTMVHGSIVVAALVLAGGIATAAQAQSAPAPAMKVGDRWVYNVKSGFGLGAISYQETREVTAVGGGGFKVTVTGKTANNQDFTRVDEYSAGGALRSGVGSSRVDLQACKLEYSIVSPK